MSAPLTPEHVAQVRAIAAEMIGQALRGVEDRLRAAIDEAISAYDDAAAAAVGQSMNAAVKAVEVGLRQSQSRRPKGSRP